MSKTSRKSYTVKAREGNILNLTKNENIRLNATRRNPRADEEGQKKTLSMSQMFDYIYILTEEIKEKNENGDETLVDIIKGVTFKPLDGIEITGYVADTEVKNES